MFNSAQAQREATNLTTFNMKNSVISSKESNTVKGDFKVDIKTKKKKPKQFIGKLNEIDYLDDMTDIDQVFDKL